MAVNYANGVVIQRAERLAKRVKSILDIFCIKSVECNS